MEIARRIAKNTAYNTSALMVSSILGLLISILLARILKPEYFGIYSLALVIANISIAFATLGIRSALVRYIAYFDGKGNIKSIRWIFRYLLKFEFVLAFTISFILIISSVKLSEFFGSKKLIIPFAISGFIVLIAPFSNFLDSFFRGLQRFEYTFFKQVIYEISRLILVIYFALMFFATGALIGTVLSYFIVLVYLMLVLLLKYREYIFGEYEKSKAKIKSYVGFMTVARVSGIIYAYIDCVMIGYLLGATDVGYYRAAYTIVFAIIDFISSISGVLLPVFSQLSIRDINRSLEVLNRYVAIVTFPLAVILAWFSKNIILTIYGSQYLPAVNAMVILSFALIPGAFNYLISVINAKERADITASIVFTSMILNVILNYFLILHMNIAGAALATLISRIFVILFVIIVLYKIFGILPKIKVCLKPIISTLIILILMLILPEPKGLIVGFIEILMLLSVYFSSLFIIKGLNKDDIIYLIKVIRG